MPDEMIKSSKALNTIKGKSGEAAAVSFLQNSGYKIVETNYKVKFGEIDVIALDKDDRVIFVEVKARSTAKFGYPREAVTAQKQKTLRRVAELYLLKKKLINAYTRFDVVETLNDKITHIKNAF